MTGGGDCPGLNAVIRAIVKTAHDLNLEVIGFRDGFRGMVVNEYVSLAPRDVVGILIKGGTILGSSNRDDPFNFRISSSDGFEYKDMSDQVMENARKLDLESIIVIGGDGTLSCAYDFMQKGLKIIGVPKTIDNDLNGTDMTFGFMTAIDTATDALEKLHTTAESHHRIMVLEVMGREAGWIALQAGIAGGADIVLIPEIPFSLEKAAAKILARKDRGRTFSIVIVAEGARPLGGKQIIKRKVEGSPIGHRLGGIGAYVAAGLEEITGFETRVTVLGHLQRGGKPSAFDRILASRYGVAAAKLAYRKSFGRMVSLAGTNIMSRPIDESVKEIRAVPSQGEMVMTAKNIGISFGD